MFEEYRDVMEGMWVEEGFVDVREKKKGIGLGVDIGKEIKEGMGEEVDLVG